MSRLPILTGMTLGVLLLTPQNAEAQQIYNQVKSNVTSIAQCVLGKVDEQHVTYITNVVIDDVSLSS